MNADIVGFQEVFHKAALGEAIKRSHRDVYYTHLHDGHHESLDHILLSEEFSPTNPDRIGSFEYMRVLNDHLIDQKLANEEIPAWQSDHGQVIVLIELY
jgi:hypothetical protein